MREAEIKVWDNGPVHVVAGPNAVLISIPKEASHRLALLLHGKLFPDLEGWRELAALRSALDCLLVGDPASVRRANQGGYLSTLPANARDGVPSPRPHPQG